MEEEGVELLQFLLSPGTNAYTYGGLIECIKIKYAYVRDL